MTFREDKTLGTGKYPAQRTTDPSLDDHTIYAPKAPPQGIKLPVLLWGSGGCSNDGPGFSNFLKEIASYGYLVLANGALATGGFSFKSNSTKQMTAGVDWVLAGKADFAELESLYPHNIFLGFYRKTAMIHTSGAESSQIFSRPEVI
jgi:hypothetical protein